MALQLGDTAPDFTANSTQGEIEFHAWKGESWAILFSHPKDFTPVCTTELGTVAQLRDAWDANGVKVIGLSVDTVESHKEWEQDIAQVMGEAVNFPVLADPDREIANLYGMIHPKALDTMTVRSVFIIKPDNTVALTLTYPAAVGRNFDEILRVVTALQVTATHPVATPANWQDGDEVIISPKLSDEEAKAKFPEFETVKPYLRTTAQPE